MLTPLLPSAEQDVAVRHIAPSAPHLPQAAASTPSSLPVQTITPKLEPPTSSPQRRSIQLSGLWSHHPPASSSSLYPSHWQAALFTGISADQYHLSTRPNLSDFLGRKLGADGAAERMDSLLSSWRIEVYDPVTKYDPPESLSLLGPSALALSLWHTDLKVHLQDTVHEARLLGQAQPRSHRICTVHARSVAARRAIVATRTVEHAKDLEIPGGTSGWRRAGKRRELVVLDVGAR
ncbi:hypothetical protein NMY22_g10957 [Coprinellus aureogranulatus]|nr:hypothetical protein NMY22_g10957 [Coprinellus aureogranulatus]